MIAIGRTEFYVISGALVLGLIAVGIIILFAFRSVQRSLNNTNEVISTPASREAPYNILRERYARGEITKEQFEQMRRDLEM